MSALLDLAKGAFAFRFAYRYHSTSVSLLTEASANLNLDCKDSSQTIHVSSRSCLVDQSLLPEEH